jgi:OmcA/MtrC family decaheme c-type cytochrome
MVPDGVPIVEYELVDVELTVDDEPVVTFGITADGAAVDVDALPAGLTYGTYGPSFRVAYSTPEGTVLDPADFNNFGNGLPNAQPERFRVQDLLADLVDNGDGTYTTMPGQLGTVPIGAFDLAVAMEGAFEFAPAVGDPFRIAGNSQALGPEGDFPRRQVVSIDKCNDCHERLSFHGEHRVDNINLCVTCHNPNATDRAQRPEDPVDGLQEQSIAFGPMIHAIHAGHELEAESFVIYGFGQTPHDYAHLHYPAPLRRCDACHLPDTTDVPLADGVLAVSKLTGDDLVSPLDDQNVSPTGANCTGCHDSTEAMEHAKVTPAFYSDVLSGGAQDQCSVCHGPAGILPVQVVHELPDPD